MALIDVSKQRRSLLRDAVALNQLPSDLLKIINNYSSPNLLDAVAEAALIPSLTERIYVHFENVFPDICARWALGAKPGLQSVRAVSALARILPYAPDLFIFIRHQPTAGAHKNLVALGLVPEKLDDSSPQPDDAILLASLLSIWRLLSFDLRAFSSYASPALMQRLFEHENRAVRYLAIRVFCQLLHASDLKLEALIKSHIGDEAILGDFDGLTIDYGFLSLHEHNRVKKFLALRKKTQQLEDAEDAARSLQPLTPYTVAYGQVLLPRPFGPVGDPPSLVHTETTMDNLERLAQMIRNPGPDRKSVV